MGSKPPLLVAGVAALGLAVGLGVAAAPAFAAPPTLTTPATEFHGLPNNNPSRGGNSANPNGRGPTGGGGIHGIGNNPGQSGNHPSIGAPGFADQLNNVHGGLGAANPNVP